MMLAGIFDEKKARSDFSRYAPKKKASCLPLAD
jgi:hypothetical protein